MSDSTYSTSSVSQRTDSSLIPSLISTKNVEKYHLPNGLTVLLEVNQSAPIISFQIGVKVGSVWEGEDEAGLSHVLEHMVFKGTKSYGPGEIAKIVEASGGELNAYTSLDQTVYYINLSSKYWLKGLSLIKEMVLDARIDVHELEREKEVVLEEIRRGKDHPQNQLSEMLFDIAFQKHPYGRPIIGTEESVRCYSRDKVADFYHHWYVPNNFVLGICGDFNKGEMRQAISNLFAEPSRLLTHPSVPDEPPPVGRRQVKRASSIEGYYLDLAFQIPHFKHKDIPALDLLSHMFGDGPTSLLEQIVKEKQGLVNSIHSYAYTPRFPGLFIIGATAPQKTAAFVLPAIMEQIDHCRRDLFSTEYLGRAKLNLQSDLYYEKETCEGTARKWMIFETTADDFKYEEEYFALLQSVTPEEIRRVARGYLDLNRSMSACLYPKGKSFYFKAIPSKTQKKWAQESDKTYDLVQELGGIKKFRLKNGLTIITKEIHRVPLMAIRVYGLGGLRSEGADNNGISQLTMSLLEKGTKTRTAREIAEVNEKIAGHISGVSGRNTWGLSANFLSSKKDLALDLFQDLLINPSFEATELVRERKLALEAIKNQKDNLAHMAFQSFQAALYKRHPYGMSLLGTAQSVMRLSREQIIRFYEQMLHPEKMVVACVGDFEGRELMDGLASPLASLENRITQKLKLPVDKRPVSPKRVELKIKKNQAHIVLGFMATTLSDPNRYAFDVLNNILAGQGGRLFIELRDKKSLAYSLNSILAQGIEPGYFATYVASHPSKVHEVIDGILSELRKIQVADIPSDELARAKNYITGNFELDLQRLGATASVLSLNELYEYDLNEFFEYANKIRSVTTDQVRSVANQYFDLKAPTIAIVRPPQ